MQPLHAPQHTGSSDVWGSGPGRSATHSASPGRPCAGSARQVYGSDWPVVSNNPLLGIANGLNRQPWRPGDPEQRQTLENLLVGYTRDAAWAEFQEDRKGMLRVGFLADLALLLRDIFATPAAEAGEMTVDLTVCDGRVVWRGGGRGQNSKIWPQRFCLLGCSEEISIHVFTWHSTGTFLLQPRTRSLIFRNSLKVTSAYNSHSSEKEKTSAFPTRFQPILGRSEAQKPTYGKLSDKSELYP
ncbi:MAG: amidohydrolase family protein [Caldilineaceae bacterium]|nr:amidohydrolase family protein [Caldilineaceae bacterium]